MGERTRVAETVAAMPKIEQGVTQTDIEQYGFACYQAGRKAGRRELRDELKAKRDSVAGQITEALSLAAALRDAGLDEDVIEKTTLRVMLGPQE